MKYEYEGPVYCRPVYRGVIVGKTEDNRIDLDDIVIDLLEDKYSLSSGWDGQINITIELKENERQEQNKDSAEGT
jgi:hypothetical protein